jgi:hypothetical protein
VLPGADLEHEALRLETCSTQLEFVVSRCERNRALTCTDRQLVDDEDSVGCNGIDLERGDPGHDIERKLQRLPGVDVHACRASFDGFTPSGQLVRSGSQCDSLG